MGPTAAPPPGATPPPPQAPPKEWPGLAEWRARGVDRRRMWGDKGPSQQDAGCADVQLQPLLATPGPPSLVQAGLTVLHTADPALKCAITHSAWTAYSEGRLPLGAGEAEWVSGLAGFVCHFGSAQGSMCLGERRCVVHFLLCIGSLLHPAREKPARWRVPAAGADADGAAAALPERPARPLRPELVTPKQVPGVGDSGLPLAAHLLHNLSHIELNAVDLAWCVVGSRGGGGGSVCVCVRVCVCARVRVRVSE